MALLVYKFSNYENTAEREQYRSLCKKLKSFYGKSDELCIFIANFNIYDCELDGIIIKQDAIIAVEFKNYKGEVIAVDNGEWKLSGGTIIKGGSRKTVYQQANLNHVAIKRGFKDGNIVDPKQVKNVSALVVFHQPITLVNNLSPKTQSWLHVCDESDFLAKVQDITSKSTDLSLEQMLTIIERLNLTQDYLDKTYSNKDFFENLPTEETVEDNDETQIEQTIQEVQANLPDIESTDIAVPNKNHIDTHSPETDKYRESLCLFAKEILNAISPNNKYSISVFSYDEMKKNIPNIEISKEYIVLIKGQYNQAIVKSLPSFLGKKVSFFDDMFYWEEGDDVEFQNCAKQVNVVVENQLSAPKSETYMPNWLDDYVFNTLNARYNPDHVRHEYNLDLNKQELLTYLGTYFPRSYSEAINILSEISQKSEAIQNLLVNKAEISILDFGCGSGGEIYGTLSYIESTCQNIKSVKILAIDGNQGALRLFEQIMSEYIKHSRLHIEYIIGPVFIESQEDLTLISSVLTNEYDLIISFKAICEMVAKEHINGNAYKFTAQILAEHLAQNGILIIEDVTIKNEKLGLFLPNYMNDGINEFIRDSNGRFKSILPLCCGSNEKTCTTGCFKKEVFEVSHSRKNNDISKIFYRVIIKDIN